MTPDILDRLTQARTDKRSVALLTHIARGEQRLIFVDDPADDLLAQAAKKALIDDKPITVDGPDGAVFINVFNPALRLIIVGAVHIAQPLSVMASLAGYGVTIIDPRTAFASPDRFPGLALDHDWPDQAMTKAAPDRRTAIVLVTHDPKLDDPALHVALRSSAFYIGALGSKKTHGARHERLKAAGFSADEIARIHGPVGLDIGAKSPAEIAISILAEMTRDLRQGP